MNNVPCYNVICFPNGPNKFNNAHVVSSIPARWPLHPSYMHTFGMTQNYFIIIEQPLSISMVATIKARLLRKPLASMFKWFDNECTLIHAICRRSGRLKYTFKAAAFFFLHVINAYEEDNQIILDICCYRDPSVLDCMYVDAMENMQRITNYADMFKSRPLRFVLPINVPCSDSFEDNAKVIVPWHYGKVMMNCFKRTQSVDDEKPQQIIDDNMNRMFDDTTNMMHDNPPEIRCFNRNLVRLKNSTAKAYRLTDDVNYATVFCVPELLCELGCETPRINEKQCQGE